MPEIRGITTGCQRKNNNEAQQTFPQGPHPDGKD